MDELLSLLNLVKPNVDFVNCNELVDNGILDSIDIIEIISAIESKYEIELKPEDIDPDNFQSADTIFKMINTMIAK